MSDAFILRSGGGNGLSPNSAVIHVTAPVGSTISFAKGGVVAKVLGPDKSHVNSADESLADWYYSVSVNNYGTWEISASLDADNTASASVTVNSNEQYDVALTYLYYLYNKGNEFTDRSGGWAIYGNAAGEKRDDGLLLKTNTYGSTTTLQSRSVITLAPFTSVVFKCSQFYSSTESGATFGLVVNNNLVNYVRCGIGNAPKNIVVSVGSYPNAVIRGYTASDTSFMLIESIWLE